jgi:hypothetical protein
MLGVRLLNLPLNIQTSMYSNLSIELVIRNSQSGRLRPRARILLIELVDRQEGPATLPDDSHETKTRSNR